MMRAATVSQRALAAIARRLDIYAEQTAPLTSAYAARGLLVRVAGIGDVDEVAGRSVAT